ncbi:MAG: TrbI/VirB10 family protein [Bdellovibrionaceae bacterium]|nr:TrbI/VirB10 family protein [Pseudobdellovibrionaceae bacterium]
MKETVAGYFLEEKCPFTGRRTFKARNIKIAVGTLVVVPMLFILFWPAKDIKSEDSNTASNSSQGSQPTPGSSQAANTIYEQYRLGSVGTAKPLRQYGASQLVRRGDGNDGDKLPMGSTIPAKLLNAVLSSDSNSPVIAEVMEEVYWKNTVMIPAGTKAIGQGTLDDGIERLQVRFHTLVYPEGQQKSISALALLGDGSSGIAGDFHSRTFPKQAGRFAGTFIGGLAQGLKDKDSRGQAGIVFEPGSLKNGLLNGIAASSLDQANALANDSERLKPYLEVPSGTAFLLYLEREFSP